MSKFKLHHFCTNQLCQLVNPISYRKISKIFNSSKSIQNWYNKNQHVSSNSRFWLYFWLAFRVFSCISYKNIRVDLSVSHKLTLKWFISNKFNNVQNIRLVNSINQIANYVENVICFYFILKIENRCKCQLAYQMNNSCMTIRSAVACNSIFDQCAKWHLLVWHEYRYRYRRNNISQKPMLETTFHPI